MTLSIKDTQYKSINSIKGHNAEWHVFKILTFSVVMLNVVMLSVVMLNVGMLSVLAPIPQPCSFLFAQIWFDNDLQFLKKN